MGLVAYMHGILHGLQNLLRPGQALHNRTSGRSAFRRHDTYRFILLLGSDLLKLVVVELHVSIDSQERPSRSKGESDLINEFMIFRNACAYTAEMDDFEAVVVVGEAEVYVVAFKWQLHVKEK